MNLTEKDLYEVALRFAMEKPTIGYLQNKMRISYSQARSALEKMEENNLLVNGEFVGEISKVSKKIDQIQQTLEEQFQQREEKKRRKEKTIQNWIERKIQKIDPEFSYQHRANIESFSQGIFRIDFEEFDLKTEKYVLFRENKKIAQMIWEEEADKNELSS